MSNNHLAQIQNQLDKILPTTTINKEKLKLLKHIEKLALRNGGIMPNKLIDGLKYNVKLLTDAHMKAGKIKAECKYFNNFNCQATGKMCTSNLPKLSRFTNCTMFEVN